jgi:adenylate cyclase
MPAEWPHTRSPILDWLVRESASEPYIDDILVQLCEKLRHEGVLVARSNLIVRTNHPQWLGARMLWRTGMAKAELQRLDYDGLDRAAFLQSPVKAVLEGEPEIRGRLHALTPAEDPYPLFDELRREGLTDYVCWPIQFTRGQRHVLTFATDQAGGFTDEQMTFLRDLVPLFTLVAEIRLRNRLARTFLETYVGPHASEQILAGATRRGSGVTLSAVIVIYDLRGFTAISEHWPRDDVIAMLNDYFDAVSDPVERNGGEILKFMGDGLLAIFPLQGAEAPKRALHSVVEARANMAAFNLRRGSQGLEPIGYGVGVHVGDVMYGNIGSRSRLDFTVIGPAVNVASRLETLTKAVRRGILLSGDFVEQAGDHHRFEPLGALTLPGVAHPVDVFALTDPESP